jgi:hypothetical protein
VKQAMEDQAAAAEKTAAAVSKQLTEEELLDKQAAKRASDMEAIDRSSDAMQQVAESAKKTDDVARQLGLTFSSAFEDAIVKGKSFRDVLQGIEQDVARIIVRQAITTPMATAISSGMTGMFGGGKAEGGAVSAGMSYLVGEHGPEMLTMGANSGTITPSGGGGTYYIDARGADAAAIARLEAGLRQVNASIEYRAVGAVQRAYNTRGATTPMG